MLLFLLLVHQPGAANPYRTALNHLCDEPYEPLPALSPPPFRSFLAPPTSAAAASAASGSPAPSPQPSPSQSQPQAQAAAHTQALTPAQLLRVPFAKLYEAIGMGMPRDETCLLLYTLIHGMWWFGDVGTTALMLFFTYCMNHLRQ